MNILRMIQYDKRWPEIEIPYWLAPDILLLASMAEKTATESPLPKLCIVDRKWNKITFGWDASTAFCTSQEKNKQYPTKLSDSIPPEAELYLLEEIAEAASSSLTHTYVLHHLENELSREDNDNRDDSSSSLEATAGMQTESNKPLSIHVKVRGRYQCIPFHRKESSINLTTAEESHITSPQLPIRKNKPGGIILSSGSRVHKQGHHSNHGKAASHKRKSQTDVVSARQVRYSYPTSAQYHFMHGNLQLFAKILYPLERQLLKYLVLRMTGAQKLSEVKLQKEHKKQLHKVR
jgi:hypothetical protein